MTPDIMNEDGSCIDVKTVKKRDGTTAEFDVVKMSAAMSSAALAMGRNGKSLSALWTEMYQTTAISSLHLGGAPCGQMTAISATQRQSRRYRQPRNYGSSDKGYAVDKGYPYTVTKNIDDGTNPLIWFERWSTDNYDTRMEAEKASLKSLVKYQSKIYHQYAIEPTQYKRRVKAFAGYNNPMKAKKAKVILKGYQERLKNIEEDYPEWLI